MDHAGLASDTYSDAIVLDINPPTIFGISPGDGREIKSSTLTASWSGEDETSGIDHYEIKLNDGSWIDTGKNTAYTFTGVSDGNHVLNVKATDGANNSRQIQIRFSVDTSLIGGPGWTDDIIIFSTVSIVVAIILVSFFLVERIKQHSMHQLLL